VLDQQQDEAARERESSSIIIIDGHEQTCGGSHESFYMTAKAQPVTPLRKADERIREWPFGGRIVARYYKEALGKDSFAL
jgi:hypothetical protein